MLESEPEAMIILVAWWQHSPLGASRSDAGSLPSRRLRTLARHLGFALNQAVGCSGGGQFAITSSISLSALRPKSCLAEAALRQNPHKRQTTRRCPRVRSSEAFGRRPPPAH